MPSAAALLGTRSCTGRPSARAPPGLVLSVCGSTVSVVDPREALSPCAEMGPAPLGVVLALAVAANPGVGPRSWGPLVWRLWGQSHLRQKPTLLCGDGHLAKTGRAKVGAEKTPEEPLALEDGAGGGGIVVSCLSGKWVLDAGRLAPGHPSMPSRLHSRTPRPGRPCSRPVRETAPVLWAACPFWAFLTGGGSHLPLGWPAGGAIRALFSHQREQPRLGGPSDFVFAT